MTENTHDTSLSLDDFAKLQNVTTRSVRRWVDAGEVPSMYRDPFSGEMRFPRDAVRQIRPKFDTASANGQALAHPVEHQLMPSWLQQPHEVVAPPAEPTRLEELDEESSFLSISDAAHYLGVPQAQIRANPETFALMPVGINGSLMVPKSTIRKFEGK